MGRNDMLHRMAESYRRGFHDGGLCGQQQGFDAVMLYLHRNGWGARRILRLHKGVGEILDEYAQAFHTCMEQDVYQERMDREILDALKGEGTFSPFRDRYPMIKTAGYDRLPRRGGP